MVLRFILAVLGMAAVGAAIGYSVEGELFDAGIGAAIGVALVVWAGIRVLRETLAKGKPPSGTSPLVKWGIVAAALFLIAIAGYFALEVRHDEAGYLWTDSQVALEPLQALKGVRMGEAFADVKTRLGPFEADSGSVATGSTKGTYYVQRGGRIRVLVVGDRVQRVSYECAGSDSTRVNRIDCNDREVRVVSVFGNAARRLCSKAADSFTLDVLDTGTRYLVVQGRVAGMILMTPQDLETALGGEPGWRRC